MSIGERPLSDQSKELLAGNSCSCFGGGELLALKLACWRRKTEARSRSLKRLSAYVVQEKVTKMPSTRSQCLAQPTLSFPRRKSCRGSSKTEAPQVEKPSAKKTLAQTGPKTLAQTGPMKPIPLLSHAVLLSPRRGATAIPPSPARLPLSPRKRTGEDNALNVGAQHASPPKQSRATTPLLSPRRLAFDENSPVCARRRLIPSSPAAASSPGQRSGSPARPSPDRKESERSRFLSVKQALHTAIPPRLLSRDHQRDAISSFLRDTAARRLPGGLYISGAPGTGKTACLDRVLLDMKEELVCVHTLIINCMSVRSSHSIFPLLAHMLHLPDGPRGLQAHLTSPGPAVLLVLDEMDQLDSKSQDILYTIFEWPHLPKSRLCLIGVANALDLTDRILPRLQARPRCRPQLLNFPPYSRQELSAIVQDRLAQASAGGILDAAAVQFCARKVSAVSGDARKALDICRRAVEMVESDGRKKVESDGRKKVESDGRKKVESDGRKTACQQKDEACRVSVPQVARVLSEVYGDRMASQGGAPDGENFPLQQKLLVCCLLLLARGGKSKEVVLGKLHEVHSRLCAQRQVGGVSQAECLSLCSLLESQGVFALKKAKEARLTKVFLKIEEKDVENALKDRTLVGSILAAGLP
ncbi:cell division control protein 6 homolog isoform X2 [Entelurus aequoreus]|uniref:cell division control protein 6 homolog isoform X2 n=1 Tax=Entelurus aequoreus TaxID=161455 RepID=UPI002B1DFD2E|nr:cell division control protein 6 homolog isoform X2 [Entelurus aequoreus]